MKITIIAINNFDKNYQKDFFNEYAKRLRFKLELKEIKPKVNNNSTKEIIKKEEAKLILKNLSQNSLKIALDEHGLELTSLDFAKLLQKNMNIGNSHIEFIIGGAFGLDDEILRNCHLKICLGRMTLPHILARIVLIEQIYRAQTIIDSHPYHKE